MLVHSKPTMVLDVSGGNGRVGAGEGGRHCFRLIQIAQEELQGIPASCSFNNSRVAEVQVCGSYAREHNFLFYLSSSDIFSVQRAYFFFTYTTL